MFGELLGIAGLIGVGGLVGVLLFALIGAVPFLLIFLAIKWAVRGGIRDAAGKMEDTPGNQTARQILDERYARGEIGREEYEQMRRDIQN